MKPNDNSRLLLAAILSMFVLLLWQYFYNVPKQKQYQEQLHQYEASIAKIQEKRKALAQPEQAKEQKIETQFAKIKSIKINTPNLQGSISLKGARFDDLTLKQYKQTDEKSPNVVLLSPSYKDYIYFAELGWLSDNADLSLPNSETIWSSNNSELSPNNPVILTWKNNQGITFKMKLSVDDGYMFTIDRQVENNSKNEISLANYGILNRVEINPHTPDSNDSAYTNSKGPIGVFNKVLSETTFKDIKETKKLSKTNVQGWIGFTDKYWFTAIIPNSTDNFDANFSYYFKDLRDRFQVDYITPLTTLKPGSSHNTTARLFAGAKQVDLLDKYSSQYNIALFDRAVDFGWFYSISKPIFKLLTYFHKLVGNFGVAILLLTIFIKIILFPLAYKSYVSMYKMKEFQPQIMAIRERYEHDRVHMNKEILNLYRREKINPASGCLPILLQIPVFFALYRVLSITIEMRHAPFFGWIHNLSAPDPTSIFNLFGLLPFNPPPILCLGVWPIIMGITMYFQQKINPQPTDPIQAKVMKGYPYFFTFILYKFPAGLVIYWAWNNTLTIIQQLIITKLLAKKIIK